MEVHGYTWIFATSMVVAFLDAYGIGANDVANSFATSVSSGSLSLAQACIVACFTEFGGAVLLGAETAETIKGGILSPTHYVEQPEMLMLAMFCAICGSALWVLTASRYGWPVSTTHSIVGAVIGVGISAFGAGSIDWSWEGVAQIIASWFISPICAGIVAAIIYTITKYAILRRVESFKWGIRLVPVYFFFTAAIEAFYIIYKAPGGGSKKMHIGLIVGIALAVAVACALFAQFFFCPWVVRRVKGREALKWYQIFYVPFLKKQRTIDEVEAERQQQQQHRPESIITPQDEESNGTTTDNFSNSEAVAAKEKLDELTKDMDDSTAQSDDGNETPPIKLLSKQWVTANINRYRTKAIQMMTHGLKQDVRNIENDKLKHVHANAEIFEDDAEYLFSFLQVITACMASFAHGSNDVSNAVGPISSIYEIWQTAQVDVAGKVPVPIWILVYGGVGIDLGLATMGYHVMRAMGNNITYFTPSRGFCAELAAALTVLTCSQLGLPISTTHCIVGASTAIGLCNRNGLKAVNWKMLAMCFFSWFITLPSAGLVAGLLFALCANSPKFL